MRSLPVLPLLLAALACTQPAEPMSNLAGDWTLEGGVRPLAPSILSLKEFGRTVVGSAVIAGLDPIGPGQPVVSVSGAFSPPAAVLEISIGAGKFARYAATMDSPDHLVGVLTYDDALGGASDTLSYLRQ
jgi:hypothetical protein